MNVAAFELTNDWLQALAPPPIIAPSAFAESEVVLPSSANAEPGPLCLASYQRELVEAIADDETEIIVFMLSSQVGKSLSVDAMMGYCIGCAPGPMLHVSPTAANAESFVRNRFDPIVGASPALRALVGRGQATRKGSTGGADSKTSKTFPGGQLDFASSHKADELAARAIKYLFLDEVDRFARTVGVEGDPVGLAMKRTTTFAGKGRKVVIVSTPTSRFGSRIHEWFLRGDQRRFHLTCPDCGHAAPVALENLKWEVGKPEAAALVCDSCGVVHDEVARLKMVATGFWRATAAGTAEKGIRSYHLNEIVSKFSNLANVARAAEVATTPSQKQVFYNTALAEVYDAGTEVDLSPENLEHRAEEIVSPYDAAIVAVTAGVDVQGDRIELTFLAHAVDGRAWVLKHLRLSGDTSADAVWADLDVALGARFDTRDGRTLSVAVTAIDSGFATERVVTFVAAQRRKSRSIFPIKGVPGFGKAHLREGGKLKGYMRVMLVGVDEVKLVVAKRLATDEVGPNYIHLPAHLPSEYFDQLTSERLTQQADRHGYPKYTWTKVARNNEAFDALVYALAIAGKLNLTNINRPQPPRKSLAEIGAALNRRAA